MQTYDELVEFARTCVHQSRITLDKQVAAELLRMAKAYQRRAAEIDSGQLPDIGEQQGQRFSPDLTAPTTTNSVSFGNNQKTGHAPEPGINAGVRSFDADLAGGKQ